MQLQLLLLSSLAALASSAAIRRRSESPWPPAVRDFFAEVDLQIRTAKSSRSTVPKCDLSAAVLPTTTASPLPPPSDGLSVYHVAIGRGTQVRNPPPCPVNQVLTVRRTIRAIPPIPLQRRPRSVPSQRYTTPPALPPNTPRSWPACPPPPSPTRPPTAKAISFPAT